MTRGTEEALDSPAGTLSDTAFLVNESRARRADISLDVYAEHWVVPERRESVRRLWEEFSREVYALDDLELGVRNQFFLKELRRFTAEHPDAVFVNVGAGLSSYSLLLDGTFRRIEVDLPKVVEFKQRRLSQLTADGIAEPREIHFVGLDLQTPEGVDELEQVLAREVEGRPSLILMEGVSYYLRLPFLERLFDLYRVVQTEGSSLAFDFWPPENSRHPVFQRLQHFFAHRFAFGEHDYTLIEESFVRRLRGYSVRTLTSVVEEEPKLAGSELLRSEQQILLENYALLDRR